VAVNIAQSELSKLVQDLEDSTDMKNFIRQHGLGQQFEHWQTIEILRRV
jgi:DNA-binding transcriptional LysR family regulator